MLTLSFANQYYTLWDVTSRIEHGRGEVINGVFNGETYLRTTYCYLQNLSMTEEAAVVKITNMAGGEDKWERNEELKGHSRSWESRRPIQNFAPWQFTFGMLTGTDIRTATDAWQLRRALLKERNIRTKVYARRRLIELNELIRYTWEDTKVDGIKWSNMISAACERHNCSHSELPSNVEQDIINECNIKIRRNYTTQKHAAMLETKKQEAALSGHFSEDGKRVEFGVKEIRRFSFDGKFGTTWVVTYITAKGNIVKYMGGTPPDISTEDFTRVKATIKHDEYKGVKETKLQRIKIIATPVS